MDTMGIVGLSRSLNKVAKDGDRGNGGMEE